ncbi:MAG: HisA/HisF-related TIM barrel protein, partial [Thermoanaerobaculia bacterium]
MSATDAPLRPVVREKFAFLPAIDILEGRVVRLERGEFASARSYGTPDEVVAGWDVPLGTRIHVVDLEASRLGRPVERTAIERLVECGYRVQIGGGIRTPEDARSWLRSGAERLILGTLAAEDPAAFRRIVEFAGPARIIAAVDLLDGAVRISGWEKPSTRSVEEVFADLEIMGVQTALVTDIRKDGVLKGPSFDLYRELADRTSLRIIASGGAATLGDVASLARMDSLAGVVVGKALHERRFTYQEALARVRTARAIPERIIPCLDIRGGRVVKGVKFEGLRDAGDPVECAKRYELEGADEIAVLDISATTEERASSLDVIRRIGESIFIP